jgi:hypothetical protein
MQIIEYMQFHGTTIHESYIRFARYIGLINTGESKHEPDTIST